MVFRFIIDPCAELPLGGGAEWACRLASLRLCSSEAPHLNDVCYYFCFRVDRCCFEDHNNWLCAISCDLAFAISCKRATSFPSGLHIVSSGRKEAFACLFCDTRGPTSAREVV